MFRRREGYGGRRIVKKGRDKSLLGIRRMPVWSEEWGK